MMTANDNLTLLAIYISLFMAGLAASLHCIGMCGPILLGFAEAFNRSSLTINGKPLSNDIRAHRPRSLAMDFTCYHAGRIWTYAMLGFITGIFGQGIRGGSTYLGLQFLLSIAVSAAVILSGVLLLDILPTGKITTWLSGCGKGKLAARDWFSSLTKHQGWIARLLLGVVMGLLPCGMVYAMLLVAVVLPTPLHSATGMAVFGLGTLPSLTGVLLARRIIPTRFRAYGSRLAAIWIIVAGSWMMARTMIVWLPSDGCSSQHSHGPIPIVHSQ